MSDSHAAPAGCPATLRPWRGAPGEDQAVAQKVYGKRGPLENQGSWSYEGAFFREQANALGPPSPASAHPLSPFLRCRVRMPCAR
ncbi:hypothetical protein GCM10017776_03450 [Streptomyces griseoluteus]|nr:hypothetical protein GCM10017776_03450 [Streptomyces griseoluteus]